jgi:hypothetical protein
VIKFVRPENEPIHGEDLQLATGYGSVLEKRLYEFFICLYSPHEAR